MVKPRQPWNIRPAKKRASVTASIKSEVETKAKSLIDNVLKPKHVLPPPDEAQSNYITDIEAKWHGKYFYFISIYVCPSPNALSPTFESKFARMESLGGGKFALSFMRHTGEWVGIYDSHLGGRVHESCSGRSVVRAVSRRSFNSTSRRNQHTGISMGATRLSAGQTNNAVTLHLHRGAPVE